MSTFFARPKKVDILILKIIPKMSFRGVAEESSRIITIKNQKNISKKSVPCLGSFFSLKKRNQKRICGRMKRSVIRIANGLSDKHVVLKAKLRERGANPRQNLPLSFTRVISKLNPSLAKIRNFDTLIKKSNSKLLTAGLLSFR